MSSVHHYHQPNAPNTYPDDPDSDIEIDPQELGPRADHGDGRLDRHLQGRNQSGEEGLDSPIPLRNLRAGVFRGSGRRARRFETSSTDTNSEVGTESHQEAGEEDSSETYNIGDATPLLNDETQGQPRRDRLGWFGGRIYLPSYLSRRSGYVNIDAHDGSVEEKQKFGVPRSISVGQFPPPRFPPNAVSNAKYTPWGFLPRTLYNEFSFFINMYFLLVSLSQVIPQLRIGVLWSYIVPLALVLTLTLGKEAYDDIARRRRDGEANKEPYTILRLRDSSKDSRPRKNGRPRAMKSQPRKRLGNTSHQRLDAITEEEENVGQNDVVLSNIEVDEIRIRSRDLKVGDVVKLGKGQRVPADLVILQSHSTESATSTIAPVAKDFISTEFNSLAEPKIDTSTPTSVVAPEQAGMSKSPPSLSDGSGIGETFIRTDQLDGETDWKLRLASPLTQTLDPREFTRLTIIAGKPARAVNEFLGKVELSPRTGVSFVKGTTRDQDNAPDSMTLTAPLTIDNTAWANTVVASSTTILAVVVYTGAQTRQALSTSSSRSKVGLLELEINNLTKILCTLTLTLSAVLVGIQSFYTKPDKKWYVSVTRFLILFSTIIPLSLRVNLDLAKSVYAWFIERDYDMPGAVVRTSTIPEDLGRIEYLLSDKTGTLTQNGKHAQTTEKSLLTIRHRNGFAESPRWNSIIRERSHGRSGLIRASGILKFFFNRY